MAKGRPDRLQDIDILVEFMPEQHTFDHFMDVAFFLETMRNHFLR